MQRARAQLRLVPNVPRSAVHSSAPDWRGFVPILGPLLYMMESLVDGMHWFMGAADAVAPPGTATAEPLP